ncbi:MAG: ATP-binding cassette domain-containing protein [Alphaproteobacteria bacterium]
MFRLQDTLFFQLIKQNAGEKFSRLMFFCIVAGTAQGFTVFAILHGLQSLMKQGHLLFHQFLFFAISISIFYFSFRYLMKTVSLVALNAIADWRMRIAVKIRAIDMRSFENISISKIQATLLDNQAVAIEAARMMIIAASSSVMVIVAMFKMFTISFWGAGFMLFLMLLGVVRLIMASKQLNVFQAEAVKYNQKFAHSLQGIIKGFAELKLNRNKTSDLFSKEIIPDADNALLYNSKIEKSYAYGMTFFEMLNFLVLGLTLFLLPGFFGIKAEVIGQLMVVGMFCLSPISSLIIFIPLLAKTEFSLYGMQMLEDELDNASESCAKDGIANKWDYKEIAVPTFSKIKLKNLQFKYNEADESDEFHINISDFELNKGEMVFIRGGNGSGKTTLMRIISGLYTSYQGGIMLDDNPINEKNIENYRNLFAVVFTNFHIFESPVGIPQNNLEKINNIFGKMELASKVHLTDSGKFSTTDLSAGQRKRLALTCALLEGREIYLFDEVAADFDPEFRVYFYRTFLKELKATGATILAISHDDRFFDVADRVITMDKGLIVNKS